MGAAESSIIPMPMGFDYMCITFRAMSRIRMFYATKQEIDIVRETVKRFCPRGKSVGSSQTICSQAIKLIIQCSCCRLLTFLYLCMFKKIMFLS